MAADGSIVIQMRADAKSALQELNQAEKALLSIQNAAQKAEQAVRATEQRIIEATAEREVAAQREVEQRLKIETTRAEITAQKERLETMRQQTKELELQQKEQERVTAEVEKARRAVTFFQEEDRVLKQGTGQEQLDFIEKYQDILREIANGNITFDSATENLREQEARLDAIKAKITELTAATAGKDALAGNIKNNEDSLKALEKEWNNTRKEVEKYTNEIEKAQETLKQQQEAVRQLAQEAQRQAEQVEQARVAAKRAQMSAETFLPHVKFHLTFIEKIVRRLGSYFRRVFIFSVITSSLRSIRSGLSALLKQNEDLQHSLARLKGTLLTAFAPIWNTIEPLLTQALDTINNIAQGVAEIIAHIFGTTREEAAAAAQEIYNQATGMDELGDATKKAGKAAKTAVADFDQLHKLNVNQSNEDEQPIFDTDSELPSWLKTVTDFIDRLRDRISDLWGTLEADGTLDKIQAKFDDLKKKLSDFVSEFTINVEDILFKWDDLTPEDLAKKILAGIGALLGGIAGFVLGGPLGALKGMIYGATLGIAFGTLIFDNDGVISPEEILTLIASALLGLTAGLLVLAAGGSIGAAIIYAGIGFGLGIAISKLILNGDGKLSPEEIFQMITAIVFALSGGLLGFSIGGPVGALIGLSIGAALGMLINKLIFNGDGTMNAEEIASMISALVYGISGGILGFMIGGPFGAVIGFGLGAALGLIISKILLNGDGKMSGEEIAAMISTLVFAISGGILGFILGGPVGAIIGFSLGAALGLSLSKLIFNNDGKASAEEIISMVAMLVFALSGGVLGMTLGGPIGAVIGVALASALGLGLTTIVLNNDGTMSAEEIISMVAAVIFAISGGILGFTLGGPAGAIIGFGIGAALGLTFSAFQFDFDGSVSYGELLTLISAAVFGALGATAGILFAGPLGGGIGLVVGATLGLAFSKIWVQDNELAEAGAVEGFTALVENIKGTVTSGLEDIKARFKEIGGNFLKGIDENGTAVLRWLDSVEERRNTGIKNTLEALDDFKGKLKNRWNNYTSDWADLLKSIGNGLTNFKGDLAKNFENIWENIKKTFGNIKDGVGDLITSFGKMKENLKGTLDNALLDFVNWSGELAKGGEQLALDILDSLSPLGDRWTNFIQGWKDLLKSWGGFFTDALKDFINWSGEISKAGENLVKDILDKLGPAGERWSNFVQGWANIFQSIYNSVQVLRDNLVSIGNSIWDGLKNVFNNIIGSAESLVNTISNGFGDLLEGIFSVPGKLLEVLGIDNISITVPRVSLPRLAEGAVIPANREFLAVLGDQKQGTNIEAPLTTIEQALRNVMQEQGGGDMTVVVQMGSEKIAEKVIKQINQLSRARGTSVIRV